MKRNLQTQTQQSINKLSLEAWLDKQGILQMMHISSRTLQKWITLGMLPFYKIAGKIYYRQSELDIMLEKCSTVKKIIDKCRQDENLLCRDPFFCGPFFKPPYVVFFITNNITGYNSRKLVDGNTTEIFNIHKGIGLLILEFMAYLTE